MRRTGRRLWVTASGNAREATVDPDGRVTLDGIANPVEVRRLDATTFRAIVGGLSIRVDIVRADDGWWASAGGCSMAVDVNADTRTIQAPRHRDSDLAAPMPATVLAVLVGPGQVVRRGDALVTLEAMKMELTIRAPRDGTVGAVRCTSGELVQPGPPLVTLQPDAEAASDA